MRIATDASTSTTETVAADIESKGGLPLIKFLDPWTLSNSDSDEAKLSYWVGKDPPYCQHWYGGAELWVIISESGEVQGKIKHEAVVAAKD